LIEIDSAPADRSRDAVGGIRSDREPFSPPTVSFQTLGCRLNQSESASLGAGFFSAGFKILDEEMPADLCVINTCSVTEQAEARCRGLIRRILKKNPTTFIAVTGCYAQAGVEALRKMPGIDLIVGTEYKMDLPLLVRKVSGGKALSKRETPMVFHTTKISRNDFTIKNERGNPFAPGPTLSDPAFDFATRPNIKIQDGCDFFCSFCIIPYTRGRERSRRMEDILLEVSIWVARGHREIVLTGVNLGEYRFEEKDLSDLIEGLEALDGLHRIRISSIEPTTVSTRLLDQMARSQKLCPYLHLPLQSGSDKILAAMGRKYTRQEYLAFVEEAVEKIPNLGLGTDVMVGFPGEGEEEFQETVSLVASLPFSYLHVFPFSRRKGTRVVQMDLPAVHPSVVKKRSKMLCDLSKKRREDFYQAAAGRTVEVLFETRNDQGLFCGLTPNYIRVGVASDQDLSGQLRPVRILEAAGGLARGIVVGEGRGE